jgi:hypothetical protein
MFHIPNLYPFLIITPYSGSKSTGLEPDKSGHVPPNSGKDKGTMTKDY